MHKLVLTGITESDGNINMNGELQSFCVSGTGNKHRVMKPVSDKWLLTW